nr:TatD family hydrolase [Patescibacteria group bacterium]
DTHCHIHEKEYAMPKDEVRAKADEAGVTRVICVGTDIKTSKEAIDYADITPKTWATMGLHPHDAKLGSGALKQLANLLPNKNVVAIGECGLDYYYNHSPKGDQIKALEFQMQLAIDNNLPMSFHIRDAFDDFWPIFDRFRGLRGVVHSFTATTKELDQSLSRGLYIGLNGIMTFTKQQDQLESAKLVPLDRLVLETDAPYLTPKPHRGRINEPKHILLIADFLAKLKGEQLDNIALATTKNTCQLFGIN